MNHDADLPLITCSCAFHARRRFAMTLAAAGASLAMPAWAREGVDVGSESRFTKLVSADQIEQAAAQQYAQMKQQAAQQRALGPDSHPQVVRLRAISQRIIPFSSEWNERASRWKWEVNLIGSKQINAFCMPGGKIAFYTGILEQLQLTDDEVAMVMGHEVAHALREHARERMGKNMATQGAIGLGAAILGLGSIGRSVADMGGQLLTLKFGREDESEADLVGMELAARAGYDPRAGVSLWNKMAQASKGAPPQFLSTHPSGPTRIRDIEANLPRVEGLYARAAKPPQRFEPPAKKP
ncbi:M48 family metallopeptidase [Rhizobacter sp. SG703]|uniref:M48 family metallopeptidase n=1 Tax=Rhizobacter sp. SG703 TaxID=2587140 RepID=UPI0014473F18|nr:M48 family metallopeptidase [Rhizobacter sp. SG703]NKI96437.1 putative Zn-dependent protease [Rhizobacter sp. SG703]